MKSLKSSLDVPVYIKADGDKNEWPKDPFFYMLTKDGLFVCRNHKWFQSCAKAKQGPTGLGEQKEFVKVDYPLIPRVLIEKIVGFFHLIYEKHGWEAAVILCWNKLTQAMELVVPDQKCNSAACKYDLPKLPPHLVILGDIHSHGSWSPDASFTDEEDEMHRPGLHIVVGNINKEPPALYCAMVADGVRFKIEPVKALFEDYHSRNTKDVPPEWIDKVKEKKWAYQSSSSDWHGYGHYHTQDTDSADDWQAKLEKEERESKKKDEEFVRNTLARFARQDEPPNEATLKNELFRGTRVMPYLECERKAAKFIKAWPRIKKGMSNHETKKRPEKAVAA